MYLLLQLQASLTTCCWNAVYYLDAFSSNDQIVLEIVTVPFFDEVSLLFLCISSYLVCLLLFVAIIKLPKYQQHRHYN